MVLFVGFTLVVSSDLNSVQDEDAQHSIYNNEGRGDTLIDKHQHVTSAEDDYLDQDQLNLEEFGPKEGKDQEAFLTHLLGQLHMLVPLDSRDYEEDSVLSSDNMENQGLLRSFDGNDNDSRISLKEKTNTRFKGNLPLQETTTHKLDMSSLVIGTCGTIGGLLVILVVGFSIHYLLRRKQAEQTYEPRRVQPAVPRTHPAHRRVQHHPSAFRVVRKDTLALKSPIRKSCIKKTPHKPVTFSPRFVGIDILDQSQEQQQNRQPGRVIDLSRGGTCVGPTLHIQEPPSGQSSPRFADSSDQVLHRFHNSTNVRFIDITKNITRSTITERVQTRSVGTQYETSEAMIASLFHSGLMADLNDHDTERATLSRSFTFTRSMPELSTAF